VYDLERSSLRRLTHDVFADMQPAWEPQGRRIAFVTDRFTTDTRALTLGEYRLALIDADTGTIHAVPAFETGKHISPQWSPDGQSLYFISDSDGTSDLYRVELVDGGIRRLSVAMTGLSGFAASSPVLSVATRDGAVAVTLYESGRFAIHTLNPDAGTQVVADSAPFVVPSPLFGAPDRSALSRWPADAPASPWSEPTASSYKPRLSFEGVTQAAVTVGMDRFGAMAGTGIGVVFSDVLNTRSVAAVVQPNQALQNGLRLRETAAYGVYINRVHRWNWGAIGSVVPTLAGIRSAQAVSSVSLPDPSPVSLFRQTERATTAIAAYPFDRLRRIELQAGIGRVTFEPIAAEQSRPGLAPAPLTQEHAAAAFVSDVTNAGLTSVLHGERYRLEVAQTFGTIRYVTALADYRRYVMPVPFYTIAMRAFHFGRYGSGADDPRVPPLYLGYPALVRGFDLRSRVIDDCAAASSRCQDVDRMLGSRVAVANLELRFPILRPFGISPRMYGPLQSEVAVFVDGGLAWRKAGPSHATVWGRGVWSTGVTLRTNVLGLGLAQFDMARRLRIPGAGWVFQFNLTPAL
jgi:hypothetical protein